MVLCSTSFRPTFLHWSKFHYGYLAFVFILPLELHMVCRKVLKCDYCHCVSIIGPFAFSSCKWELIPLPRPQLLPTHTGENLRAVCCTLETALSLRVQKEKPIKPSRIFNYLFLIIQAIHGDVQVVKNSHNTVPIKLKCSPSKEF